MRTEKQLEASRLNGAKSRGPLTAEGKRRASQNSRRHGLFARPSAPQPEDRSQFREILRQLTDELQPANLTERDLVEAMAMARWKQLPLSCPGNMNCVENIIGLHVPTGRSNPGHDGPTNVVVLTGAIRRATEHLRILRKMDLQSARLDRQHDRALISLLNLQNRRGLKPVPNGEPETLQQPGQPAQSDINAAAPGKTTMPQNAPASASSPSAGQFADGAANKKIAERTWDFVENTTSSSGLFRASRGERVALQSLPARQQPGETMDNNKLLREITPSPSTLSPSQPTCAQVAH